MVLHLVHRQLVAALLLAEGRRVSSEQRAMRCWEQGIVYVSLKNWTWRRVPRSGQALLEVRVAYFPRGFRSNHWPVEPERGRCATDNISARHSVEKIERYVSIENKVRHSQLIPPPPRETRSMSAHHLKLLRPVKITLLREQRAYAAERSSSSRSQSTTTGASNNGGDVTLSRTAGLAE